MHTDTPGAHLSTCVCTQSCAHQHLQTQHMQTLTHWYTYKQHSPEPSWREQSKTDHAGLLPPASDSTRARGHKIEHLFAVLSSPRAWPTWRRGLEGFIEHPCQCISGLWEEGEVWVTLAKLICFVKGHLLIFTWMAVPMVPYYCGGQVTVPWGSDTHSKENSRFLCRSDSNFETEFIKILSWTEREKGKSLYIHWKISKPLTLKFFS